MNASDQLLITRIERLENKVAKFQSDLWIARIGIILLIGVVLFFLAASAYGQQYTVHDGNWWVSQTPGVKVGYVIGCMDHVSTANPDWSASVRFERPPTINDVCDRLDAFYVARMNRAVTLQQAIPWALLEISRSK